MIVLFTLTLAPSCRALSTFDLVVYTCHGLPSLLWLCCFVQLSAAILDVGGSSADRTQSEDCLGESSATCECVYIKNTILFTFLVKSQHVCWCRCLTRCSATCGAARRRRLRTCKTSSSGITMTRSSGSATPTDSSDSCDKLS